MAVIVGIIGVWSRGRVVSLNQVEKGTDQRAMAAMIEGLRTYLVVDIRLFAFFETPVYHVVVGEIED